MANTASEWLNGNRDYTAGLQLLQASGASAFLVDILSSGPDSYNSPKLLQEIQKLQDEDVPTGDLQPAEIDEQVNTPSAEPVITVEVYTPNEDLERKLRIDNQIRQLFKEITHLRGKLFVLPEGEELHQVARQIRLKTLKKQDLWDQLHYFNNNGKWFNNDPVNKPTPENIYQAIKNLMSVRSKAKGELKKPMPASRRAQYEKKISDINEEIEALRAKQK